MSGLVVTRYPLPIRVGSVVVCVLLAIGVTRGPVHGMTMLVTFGAICLAVAVLAYRAEVNGTEVCIRYTPFYSRRTPVRQVLHMVEGKTLVLVTATSRIPLWGLSDAGRDELFQILPHHLDMVAARPGSRVDSGVSLRRHLRGAIITGIGFLVTVLLLVPFFKGNAWREHRSSVGEYLLLACLLFFIAMVCEAGFTWVLLANKRDIDRIENHRVRRSK
jgi:hypothetical protein